MENTETQNEKHVITADDIALNPELAAAGVKVGDEVNLPFSTPQDLEAGRVYSKAIAAGLSTEEALEAVKKFYAQPAMPNVGTPTEETAQAPEQVEESLGEKVVPSVEGVIYEGKTLSSARYVGENLVVRSIEGIEFTITPAQAKEAGFGL